LSPKKANNRGDVKTPRKIQEGGAAMGSEGERRQSSKTGECGDEDRSPAACCRHMRTKERGLTGKRERLREKEKRRGEQNSISHQGVLYDKRGEKSSTGTSHSNQQRERSDRGLKDMADVAWFWRATARCRKPTSST